MIDDKYSDDEYDPTEDDVDEDEDVPKTKGKKIVIKQPKIDDEIEEDEDEDENEDDENEEEDEDDDDDENDNIDDIIGKTDKDTVIKPHFPDMEDMDNDEEDEDEDENYLQKFEENLQKNIISEFHPELQSHNSDEIDILTRIVKDKNGIIIDPLHKTLPFITRYERARILGERAKQINAGAKPLVDVDESVIDGYLIALKEFEQKKIPFIVKRPLPNGGCEYWKFKDLEII
jgi:DNA-directed RNA polymerase I, II, and III subunit RPABC2